MAIREVSRIEGFSDAVFGFVLTLLVVSGEVPDDFTDLRRIIESFPAFAVTFAVICWIWYEHHIFFRKYQLEDGVTVVLNCMLLFVVMFYAYPLKFVFSRLITGQLLGLGPGIDVGMNGGEGRTLMLLYSFGFMALFGVLAALYAHAHRSRARLGLDPMSAYDARAGVQRHMVSVVIALVSLVIAGLLPIQFLPYAGLIFFLLGPAHGAFGYWNGRRRERLEASR